jgi:hypothetical protein
MVPFAFATAFTGYTLAAPSLTFVAMTWLALTVLVPEPDDPDHLMNVPAAAPQARRKRRTSPFGTAGQRKRVTRAAGG